MVRLKGEDEKQDYINDLISIPYGAIKRYYNTTFDEVLKISIPYGAIKRCF